MIEWRDKSNSEACFDSPTKLLRQREQLDLLMKLKQKQQTVKLQKINKNQNPGSRKSRTKLKATIVVPQSQFEEKNIKENIQFYDQNANLRHQENQENIQSSKSMMKRFSGASTGLHLNIVKNQNFDDIDFEISDKSRVSIGTSVQQSQKPRTLQFIGSQNLQSIIENDKTYTLQSLATGDQDEDFDNFNGFDDEYFASNKFQDSNNQQKKDDEENEDIEDDYFSNRNLVTRNSKKKNSKASNISSQSKSTQIIEQQFQNGDQNKQRKSLQLQRENSNLKGLKLKRKMLTQVQIDSSQNDNYKRSQRRKFSLIENPLQQSIQNNDQVTKQFIIKTTKNNSSALKTSKSATLIQDHSPSSQNDLHSDRIPFYNKQPNKLADKIECELYQIVENQGDNNEKSSENLSTNQSDSEINEKPHHKTGNKHSKNQSSLSTIPVRSILKHSSTLQSNSSSGTECKQQKTSINNIILTSNNEEGGDTSKSDLHQENEDITTPNKKIRRESVRGIKKRQTLDYLDEGSDQKIQKQSEVKFKIDRQNVEYIYSNEEDQNNDIYSPLEQIVLTRSKIYQPPSNKSTLTQQFLGNVNITGIQNSMLLTSKRQRSYLIQQNSHIYYQSNNERRVSVFNLINYEDILIQKLNELLQNNTKLQRTIQTVSNVDIQTFGKQCEKVIKSAIYDNIHGKIQKIIADSNLKDKFDLFFFQILKNGNFDDQTLQIFSNQFCNKWYQFFTNSNLLEDMGGIEQIKLIVWKCMQKLRNKLSFNMNPAACSRACIRFFASLLTDNQSAIAYYMSKLSEHVLVTQMDFFLLKKTLYKVLFQLSIFDSGDLNFIMEKLENCRAYLFPEEFLRSNDLIRVISETLFKSKIVQCPTSKYFVSKDFSVIQLIIEILMKLINYEVNIDDCISVLTPMCQKPLDDAFFSELLKILRHFLSPLDSSVMVHVHHLLDRLNLKIQQQNSSFPFNSCLLEVDQEELLNDMEEWLEDYFEDDDLNNLIDIFDFKYIKFILTFAMDQREIFQIQDAICAKNVYKPTQDALKYQKKALRYVIQAKLDKKYQDEKSHINLKQMSCKSSTRISGGSSKQSHRLLSEITINQQSTTELKSEQSINQLDNNDFDEQQQQKRRYQQKQIDTLFNYLNQCTDI